MLGSCFKATTDTELSHSLHYTSGGVQQLIWEACIPKIYGKAGTLVGLCLGSPRAMQSPRNNPQSLVVGGLQHHSLGCAQGTQTGTTKHKQLKSTHQRASFLN